MPAQQIKELKNASMEYHFDIPRRHTVELETSRKRVDKLSAACDHKYPDGKDAHEGNMFCIVCTICHANDM